MVEDESGNILHITNLGDGETKQTAPAAWVSFYFMLVWGS